MRRLVFSLGERLRLHRELCRVRRRTNRVLANRSIDRCILEGQSLENGQHNSTNINYFMNELREIFFGASEKEHMLEKHFDGAFNDIESSMDLVSQWVCQSWNYAAFDVLSPIDALLLRTGVLGVYERKNNSRI